MKISNKIKVVVIREGAYSISLRRKMNLKEVILISKEIAEIWIRQGYVEKVKKEKPINN
jgi:hypothetical protein